MFDFFAFLLDSDVKKKQVCVLGLLFPTKKLS